MFITILKITKFLITKEEITETSRGQYCFIVCADLKGWGGGRGLTQVISCKFKSLGLSSGPPSAHASFTMYFYWSTASFFIVIYTWPPRLSIFSNMYADQTSSMKIKDRLFYVHNFHLLANKLLLKLHLRTWIIWIECDVMDNYFRWLLWWCVAGWLCLCLHTWTAHISY